MSPLSFVEMGMPQGIHLLRLRRRIAIRALVGGTAATLVVAAIASIAFLYVKPSNEWDTRSLRVVHAEAHPLVELTPDQFMSAVRSRDLSDAADFAAKNGGTYNAAPNPPAGFTLDADFAAKNGGTYNQPPRPAPDFTDVAQYGGTFSPKRHTKAKGEVFDVDQIASKHGVTISSEPPDSGVMFEVDIQNATASDITIPADLKVLSRTRGTHALKETVLKLDREYFIPARHTVSV
ncbi:MAG: hypothetical protein WB992_00710, partial [Bryobacteraceae bacterium]